MTDDRNEPVYLRDLATGDDILLTHNEYIPVSWGSDPTVSAATGIRHLRRPLAGRSPSGGISADPSGPRDARLELSPHGPGATFGAAARTGR